MKRAITALNKELEKQFSPSEIETLEWYTDSETDETYKWKFRFPKDGKIRIFSYHKKTKKVAIWRL